MNKSILAIIREHNLIFGVSILSMVLICLSLYNSIFAIAAFGLHIVSLLYFEPDEYIALLISLMPWAYIYKVNGVSTSLFSILVFAVVIKYVINIRYFNNMFVVLLFCFFFNVFVHFSINSSTMAFMFIKLLFNIILLYEMCTLHTEEHLPIILVMFIISVVLSSAVAEFFPQKALLYNRISVDSTFVEFKYARFKGLQNDPNYYNASLVISLLSLCYLFIKKQIGLSFFPLSVICIYFGFLTYSKSFFLLLLIWFAVVVFYSFKKKRYALGGLLLGISAVAIAFIFSGKVQLINVLMNRFTDASGATSGRTDIWPMFIRHFIENPMVLLFGNGFESLIFQTHAAHNTYIDLIYYFGIVGTVLLLPLILISFRQNKMYHKQTFSYIFLGFIMMIYFFLSGITLCEFPFVLFLVFMFFNSDEKREIYSYNVCES